jgi:hypothetical protein
VAFPWLIVLVLTIAACIKILAEYLEGDDDK